MIQEKLWLMTFFDSLFFGQLETQKSILDYWSNLWGRPKGKLKLYYNNCLNANQKLQPEMDFICRYLVVSRAELSWAGYLAAVIIYDQECEWANSFPFDPI